MAEVIGIVAVAFQLATVCMRLMETIRKIKGSSKTLKEYQSQLQDLRNLSATIGQNPLLQTPEVNAHTKSLLVLITEHNFEPLLRKPRFLRNLYFLNTQRDLLNIFDTIEKRKTSLSLIILSIEAQTLDQIRVDVKSMASPTRPSAQSADSDIVMADSGTSEGKSTRTAPLERDLVSGNPMSKELTTKGFMARDQSPCDSGNPSPQPTTSSSNFAHPNAHLPTPEEVENGVACLNKAGAHAGHYGAYSGIGVTQVNGNTYDGVRPEKCSEKRVAHIAARAATDQINGNHVLITPKVDSQPVDPNVYQDNLFHMFAIRAGGLGADTENTTDTQRNGTFFELKK